MLDNFKPLSSVFPLIDDPANIFYSRLKTIFQSSYDLCPKLIKKSRVRYTVRLDLPTFSPIEKQIDLRSLNKELESLDPANNSVCMFLVLDISFSLRKTIETTTSGETIPVDEKYATLFSDHHSRGHIIPSIEYYNYTPSGRDSHILIDLDNEKIAFLVCKVLSTGYYKGLYLLSQNSYSYMHTISSTYANAKCEESFDTIYRPIIGMKWRISKDYSSWYLFSIDSNFNEVLIDSSSTTYSQSGLLPIQQSHYQDHPVYLTFDIRKPYDRVFEYEDYYDIKVIEQDYVKGSIRNVFTYGLSEDLLYSAHDPSNLDHLLKDIRFITEGLHKEEVILSLVYILGLDIRFFLLNKSDSKVNYDDIPAPISTLNGVTNLVESDTFTELDNGDYFRTRMQNAYKPIPTVALQPNGYSTGDVIPFFQNSIGFTKVLAYFKYMLFNKEFIDALKDGMWKNTNFCPRNWIVLTPRKFVKLGELIHLVPSLALPANTFENSYLGTYNG